MFERLHWLWRIFATGVAFSAFGLGGGVLTISVFPALFVVTRSRERRERHARAIVHWSFRLFVRALTALRVIALSVENREILASCRGRMIVANHPTLLDVVLIMSINPRVQCVVKRALWRNPFLCGVVAAAGYISNDLDFESLVQQSTVSLAAGDNLLIFPEGTRTTVGRPVLFFRGFANIAVISGASILPLVIVCDPIFLTRGSAWYRIPARKPVFTISVLESLDQASYMGYSHRAIRARRLVSDLEGFYRRVLAHEMSRRRDQETHR